MSKDIKKIYKELLNPNHFLYYDELNCPFIKVVGLGRSYEIPPNDIYRKFVIKYYK